MKLIVWNGCDGYIDIDSPIAGGYNIARHADGSVSLYTQREEFHAIAVSEIDKAAVPTDENGEMILDDLYVTSDFRIWRPSI